METNRDFGGGETIVEKSQHSYFDGPKRRSSTDVGSVTDMQCPALRELSADRVLHDLDGTAVRRRGIGLKVTAGVRLLPNGHARRRRGGDGVPSGERQTFK